MEIYRRLLMIGQSLLSTDKLASVRLFHPIQHHDVTPNQQQDQVYTYELRYRVWEPAVRGRVLTKRDSPSDDCLVLTAAEWFGGTNETHTHAKSSCNDGAQECGKGGVGRSC